VEAHTPADPGDQGLYRSCDEHDACGVGFVADIKGRRSHTIVRHALGLLINLEHRGACGSDPGTGDGAGILVQMPDRFLRRVAGFPLGAPGSYGAGLVFLPHEESARASLRSIVARIVGEEGHVLLGWRTVPTNLAAIGASATAAAPVFEQVFVGRGPALGGADAAARFERALFVIRKRIEHAADQLGLSPAARAAFYIVSLSANTLIYKGMLTAAQIESMFPDLVDPDFETALALVHQRFSTNTFPSWPLAHPYRLVAHNGEINTLRGNINWMRAREGLLRSDILGDDLGKVLPIIRPGGSDTATFDNVLELLVMSGRSLPHAVLMMIPEPWSGHAEMDPAVRDFYEYSLVPDGALGRSGVHRLHRWHGHWRGARSKRPPPVPLPRHQRGARGDGIGGRGPRHPGGSGGRKGPPASRAYVPHRPARPHRRRSEIKRDLATAAPMDSGCGASRGHRGPAAASAERPDHQTVLRRQRLRLRRGPSHPARADGRPGEEPSARWAATRRWRCSRTGRGCSTTTSRSSSRR
jgi:glutamate synthase domain-containing protein 1